MTEGNARNCPSPGALARFIDGKSPAPELAVIVDHLQGCHLCRSIVEIAAEEERNAVKVQPLTRWWAAATAAAAAVVVIGVATAPLWRTKPQRASADPIHRLALAMPMSRRSVDGRLSGGFRWAPIDVNRGASSLKTSEDLVFDGVAGTIRKELDEAKDAASLHAAALAYLLTGNTDEAISRLERATRAEPTDPALWNDLAAARLQLVDKQASELGPALSAADRAIAIAPGIVEASFNRSLILKRIGLRDQARAAWNAYLRLDRTGDWADEARGHLRDLGPRANPEADRERAFAALAAGNTAPIELLLSADPQEARKFCEGPLSAEWAEAESAGDSIRAAKILSQLQFVANWLSARGEHLLEDALRAAATAEHDSLARQTLFDAYLAYDRGRIDYNRELPGKAEPSLRRAVTLMSRIKSPLAANASYLLASAIFDETRVAEARAMLGEVRSSVNRHRYPTLTAHIEWQLGRCDCYAGAWSECLTWLHDARTLFEQRGENVNVAFMDAIIAEADDRTARVEEGWRRRIAALDALSAGGAVHKVAAVLNGAVRAESFRQQDDSALSLAALAIAWNKENNEPELLTEALIQRTTALRNIGLAARARESLGEARAAALKMDDQDKRELRITELNVLEASLLRESDPSRATALLDPAISFYRRHQHAMWLPTALLARGRAFRTAGDATRALADFEAGIEEIEHQRSSIEDERRRAGFFDTTPDLFAEAIALDLVRHDVESAYLTSERARARTLYEHLGVPFAPSRIESSETLRQSLDPETVLIAYYLLPDGLAIFCLDRESVLVTRLELDPARLRNVTRELVSSIKNNRARDARTAAKEAWQLLIEPVIQKIDPKKRIILVPDRFLHSITFAALVDARTGRYLVQDHEIIVSPSATLAPVAANPKIAMSPALVIGDPASRADVELLPDAKYEARTVAGLYGVRPLVGNEATRSAIIAAAPQSALIHYAGHARSSDDDSDGEFLLAGSGRDSTLTATEIAQLDLSGTTLVTLAACGTLRGSAERIEGMPSIARAFIAAGVPYVVGTLWDVPDTKAADVFIDFHRRIHRGASPAAALRDAQIDQLKNNGYQNLSWATVAVMGAQTNGKRVSQERKR